MFFHLTSENLQRKIYNKQAKCLIKMYNKQVEKHNKQVTQNNWKKSKNWILNKYNHYISNPNYDSNLVYNLIFIIYLCEIFMMDCRAYQFNLIFFFSNKQAIEQPQFVFFLDRFSNKIYNDYPSTWNYDRNVALSYISIIYLCHILLVHILEYQVNWIFVSWLIQLANFEICFRIPKQIH